MNGHVWNVHHSSPLGVRALAREKKGFLDALTVQCSECDQCEEDLDRCNQSFSDAARDEGWFNNHPEDILPPISGEEPEDRQLREDWDDLARSRTYRDCDEEG